VLTNSPSRIDQDAHALRERFELVVLGDDDRAIAEAARALFWFCAEHREYRLMSFWPPAESAPVETAKRIESKFEGRCKVCRALIVPGEDAFWTPGEKGVKCLKCGGSK
jgi:hypothetical protein